MGVCEMKLYKIHDKLLERSGKNSGDFAGGVEKETSCQNKLIKVATLFKTKKVDSKWQVEGLKVRFYKNEHRFETFKQSCCENK